MSTQLVVRVPDKLAKTLDDVARRTARKRSDVVRLAIQQYMTAWSPPRKGIRDRSRRFIGSLNSGIPDLAERHSEFVRENLIELLRRARAS
ncbi:MAG: ribbon-helix-helix protein, CopG family [bacterium]